MTSLSYLISELNKLIKNNRKQLYITVSYSNYIVSILNILIQLGYINGYQIINNKSIYVYPKYYKGKIAINYIKRYSKSKLRKYIKAKDIKNNMYGTYILNTSSGIITSNIAKKNNIGGELLLYII